jgi:cell division protein FtsB
VLTLAAVVSLGVGSVALLSEQGLAHHRRLANEAQRLKQQNAVLAADNAQKRSEIAALKQSRRFQEKVVREDLGYVQPGEQLYLVEPRAPGEPAGKGR